MTNTNCLEGIRCPKCGQEDRFFIIGGAQFDVTDEGSETMGDHEWNDDSPARCPCCEYSGKLIDFRIRPDLPPDPDGMNAHRSRYAAAALITFMKETGTDEADALGDLLTDLMHWCDRHNYDMDAALERARGHYEAETGQDETTEARRPV